MSTTIALLGTSKGGELLISFNIKDDNNKTSGLCEQCPAGEQRRGGPCGKR